MADESLDLKEKTESLRQTHGMLQRRFRESILASARMKRDISAISTVSVWAMRVSSDGWAVFHGDKVMFTNRSFDALDRDSLIGPRWIRHVPGGDCRSGEANDDQGQTLREVAVEEGRRLLADPKRARRQERYCRGNAVVEVLVERPSAPADEKVALIFIRDVSEVTKAHNDVTVMQRRMIETERACLAAELAVGVAHDLGNLVGALRARLVGLPDDPACRLVTQALEAIVDAQAALVNRLQSVVHPRETALRAVSLLSGVVAPAVRLIESSLWTSAGEGEPRVSIDVDASVSDELVVVGPSDELINMMINLMLNARDAMPQGGTIRVSADHMFGGAQVRVEDDGTGIPPAHLTRIFEPLFSTKSGRGMGMGLATAAALMRRLGGSIVARNRPQGGACLEVTFVDAVDAIMDSMPASSA